MIVLEKLEDLKKNGLPSSVAKIIEDEIRRLLSAIREKNEAIRGDAFENLDILLKKAERIKQKINRGLAGRASEIIILSPEVIEIINETIDALQLESSERVASNAGESANLLNTDAERNKNN